MSDQKVYIGGDTYKRPEQKSDSNHWWRPGVSPRNRKNPMVVLITPPPRFRDVPGGKLNQLPRVYCPPAIAMEKFDALWAKRFELCRIVRKMLIRNIKDANKRAEIAAALSSFGADVLSVIGSYINQKPCYNPDLLYLQYCRITQ
jgi:hypothetical protein